MGPEFHQLEFRWTDEGQRGFSVIAYSESSEPMLWQDRLQGLARPPKIQQPTTVVYKIIGNEAVIMFRHTLRVVRDPYPSPDTWPVARRPEHSPLSSGRGALVARALVGPAESLPTRVALACGYLGLPASLTPPPGQARPGELLPAIPAALLEAEADAVVSELDGLARGDPALAPLVTATLAHPSTPLILQVPEAEVGGKLTAALLWGLWRVAAVYLDGTWSWTFSTGEPPAGNTDPSVLPHLVVRGLPRLDDPHATAQRSETIVQPRDPPPVATTLDQEAVAALLVAAYRALPVGIFSDRLRTICAAGDGLAARLAATTEQFREYRPRPPERSRRPQPEPDQGGRQTAGSPTVAATAGRPATAPSLPDPEPLYLPVLHLGVDMFSRLFQRLAANDGSAPADLLDMAEETEPPDRQRRAVLRSTAARHGWFVPQFARQHPREVERYIRALFTMIVEPDVADAACRADLLSEFDSLMVNERTPAAVLLAIDSLTWERHDYEFRRRLLRAVGVRWLAERGRFGRLPDPAEASASAESPARTGRLWLSGRPDGARAWWVNVLIGVLVLATLVLVALLIARI